MSNPVSAAIGTQRQFAIQPKSVYQQNLKALSVGNGISQKTDLDAALLSKSLGILGSAIYDESIAADKREREQFTTLEAEKLIAGKTPEDLAKFDRIQALQHSDKGYDLTDNPYAMATLDQSIGQVAAASAKERWASENPGTPKSINEAIQSYDGMLQETYGSFKESVRNGVAFDKGFYDGYQRDVLQVAHEAHQRINNEARAKGQRAVNVKLQGLVAGAETMDSESFAQSFGEVARELQGYVRNSDEALKIIRDNLDVLAETGTSTEKLNAIKEIPYYGSDRKIGDELPFFKYYKKVAENVNYKIADDIYESCKNADGTINWERAEARLQSLPSSALSRAIPQVHLPVSSGDLDSLKPEFKAVLPSIGGILSQLGYGDVAEFTSGYRDPERNAAAGGAENSYHLHRDAVDVYLGDLSKDEQEAVVDNFSPYFSEVLYHDAGSGLHLHLGGYRGGLDDRADDTEVTASAYTPDRLKTLRTLLKNKDRDAKVIRKQQQEEYATEIRTAVDTATNYSEKVDVVKRSTLPEATKKKLLSQIEKEADMLEDTSDMDPNELYYLTKYRKQGNKDCAYNKDYATYFNYLEESASANFEDPDDKKAKAFLKARDNLTRYEKALNSLHEKRNQSPPEPTPSEKETKALALLLEDIDAVQSQEEYDGDDLYQKVIDVALEEGIPVHKAMQLLYNKGVEPYGSSERQIQSGSSSKVAPKTGYR